MSNDALWGAQTQRSLQNFPIGGSAAVMPEPVIRAFGVLKKCAAEYNMATGKMDPVVGDVIVKARAASPLRYPAPLPTTRPRSRRRPTRSSRAA